MSNQITKMFSQQFGTKVTLKSQQTGKKYVKKKSKNIRNSRKNSKKN